MRESLAYGSGFVGVRSIRAASRGVSLVTGSGAVLIEKPDSSKQNYPSMKFLLKRKNPVSLKGSRGFLFFPCGRLSFDAFALDDEHVETMDLCPDCGVAFLVAFARHKFVYLGGKVLSLGLGLGDHHVFADLAG